MMQQINEHHDAEYVSFACFRVYVHGTPGLWEAYDGYVDVSVPVHSSEHDIFAAAVTRLGDTALPYRACVSHAWQLDSIERRPI